MFLYGLCIGAPTMFIPQIRKEANNTDIITDDMASWLSKIMHFFIMLFFFSVPFYFVSELGSVDYIALATS